MLVEGGRVRLDTDYGRLAATADARVDDGKIWLGIFKDFNYLDLIKVIPEFLAGQPLTSELMTLKTMDRVRIELLDGSHLSTNMDGDEGPAFPLDIEVLPSFLSVYVPA